MVNGPMTSTIYNYARRVHEALEAEAVDNDEHGRLWVGRVTQRILGLGVPTSAYSRVVAALTELGCITKVRAGRGPLPSWIAVHHAPDAEAFAARWPQWAERPSSNGSAHGEGQA